MAFLLRTSLLFGCIFFTVCLSPVWSAAPGSEAPAFELSTLDGESVSLREHRGRKAVLLVFWTTWCPYCKDELLDIGEFLAGYKKEALAVLGINSGWRDSVSRTKRFQEHYGLDIPLAFDHGHEVSQRYGIRGVPTILAVDREGDVAFSGHRLSDRLSDVLDELTAPQIDP